MENADPDIVAESASRHSHAKTTAAARGTTGPADGGAFA